MLNVAVVGATGNTGSGIINALLDDPKSFVGHHRAKNCQHRPN
jgi:uncharacterized protein YbjT (DUF2867 family)